MSSNIITAIKARASITEVWRALGGGPLRRNRGKAFWRGGESYSVSVDARRGVWYDFRDNVGGDLVTLVVHVRGCDFKSAVAWLAAHVGVNLSPTSTRRAAPSDTDWASDLRWATWWRICAVEFSEHSLESLPDAHLERRGLTSLLAALSLGPATLVYEYREWRRRCPALTHAMARAGRLADARAQRRLARWIMERDRG
jgi:hypothetical protein